MSRWNKGSSRYYPITIVILLLMAILVVRLFVVSVVQSKNWNEKAVHQNSKEIYTPPTRGNIYDRNGKILATNKQIFTVTFTASGLGTNDINKSIEDLINVLETNGDKYENKFPIKISKKGNYYYTFDYEKNKWLDENQIARGTSAADAFEILRNRYQIDPQLDRFDAVDEIYRKYNVNLPILAKSMKYTFDTDKKAFLERFLFTEEEIEKNPSAKKTLHELRKRFSLRTSMSDEEAIKIFAVRNEISKNGFTSYVPITVAKEISDKTITYLEEVGLKGVNVASEYIRYYPNGQAAANILGYMGSISESESAEYVKKGYSSSDMIGKYGIEGVYEKELRGKSGVKKIRVDAGGRYISTISETQPKRGKDVYLTIDLDLQKSAETALADAISAARRNAPNCESGATVAVDVPTGDVLAIASAPSYDPNIFAKGIDEKAWESVQSKNPRDPLSPAPLFNIATRSAVQSGSTFKPITAIAALECGLSPNRLINDRGHIDLGGRSFGCYMWNTFGGTDGVLDLTKAIAVSCNYYFYCIASNKDWGTGSSLGLKDMGIDKMVEVAKEMGLGSSTGIELDEVVAPLPSEERHRASIESSLRYTIEAKAHTYFPKDVAENEKKLQKNIDTIVGYMDENPDRGELIKKIDKETDTIKNQVEDLADLAKFSFFGQAKWSVGDIFNLSIGQGDNAYTPLQMARYIATIANNGERNQLSLVKGVSSEGLTKKKKTYKINLTDMSLLEDVKVGMNGVVERSHEFGFMGNDAFGKTGTAQRAGKINPKDEVAYVRDHLGSIAPGIKWEQVEKEIRNMQKEKAYEGLSPNDLVDSALIRVSNYKVSRDQIDEFKGDYDNFGWFIAAAPLDHPRIATSTMLVQGGTSAAAVPVNRDVIKKYLELSSTKSNVEPENLSQPGTNKAF
ncbi:penicillin-binding transpeptidase domain-containing protein [Anaerovoracaceae bacterium SGI.195]